MGIEGPEYRNSGEGISFSFVQRILHWQLKPVFGEEYTYRQNESVTVQGTSPEELGCWA